MIEGVYEPGSLSAEPLLQNKVLGFVGIERRKLPYVTSKHFYQSSSA
jgi:hypothetical protein